MTTTRATLTLSALQTSANDMRIPSVITNTGGNVMALAFTVDGRHALLALDYGQTSGTIWGVSLDAETREEFGEMETDDLPVTSDSDQTMMDAVAWIRHVTSGATIADGATHGYGCGC